MAATSCQSSPGCLRPSRGLRCVFPAVTDVLSSVAACAVAPAFTLTAGGSCLMPVAPTVRVSPFPLRINTRVFPS